MTTTDPETPWYRRPTNLLVLALFVLAAGIGVGLIVSADEDDGSDNIATEGTAPATTAAPSTTAAPPPTTAVTTTTVPLEDQCVGGDQLACDQLPDDRLDELCDNGRGSLDACQVLLAHQGDGVPDGPDGEGGNADPED